MGYAMLRNVVVNAAVRSEMAGWIRERFRRLRIRQGIVMIHTIIQE